MVSNGAIVVRAAGVPQGAGRTKKAKGKKKSQYHGVSWHKCKGRWRAQLVNHKVPKHLGSFDNELDAAICYDAGVRKRGYGTVNFGEGGPGGKKDPSSSATATVPTRGLDPSLKPCVAVLERIKKHPEAAAFLAPIDEMWGPEAIPGYFNIVKHPMDLRTIGTKLHAGSYGTNAKAFRADVKLVWKNCMSYNQPDVEFYQIALRMDKLFDETFKKEMSRAHAKPKPPRQSSASESSLKRQSSSKHTDKKEKKRPHRPAQTPAAEAPRSHKSHKKKKSGRDSGKKRPKKVSEVDMLNQKLDNLQRIMSSRDGAEKPSKPKTQKQMELWQKEELVTNMDKLKQNQFAQALQIIRKSINLDNVDSDDEVEIDMDNLDNKTLWKLHEYVSKNLPKKSAPAMNKKKMEEAKRVKQAAAERKRLQQAQASSSDSDSDSDSDSESSSD